MLFYHLSLSVFFFFLMYVVVIDADLMLQFGIVEIVLHFSVSQSSGSVINYSYVYQSCFSFDR